MHFDVSTLLAVHALVSATLAVVLTAFALTHRAVPGLLCWAAGSGLVAFATLAVGLRGAIPDVVSIVVANAAAAAGAAVVWNGVRLFKGKRPRWGLPVVPVGALAAFLAWHTWVDPDMARRTVAVTGTIGALCLLCSWEAAREALEDVRRLSLACAATFVVLAGSLFLRAFSALALPQASGLIGPTGPVAAYVLLSTVANIGGFFCLVAMAAQRVQREMKARGASLARLATELRTARDAAESASTAKSEFLAAMSHELRTPLNAVIGLSEIMKGELFGPLGSARYREYAGDINRAGGHLLTLIDSLLDLSKAEAGKLEIRPQCVELEEVIDMLMRLTRESARSKGVDLAAELAPGSRKLAFADTQALTQILLNLVSNAVKFTPSGGFVRVRLAASRDGTEIEVADSGIGIAAEDLGRVLRPFEQARRSGYVRPQAGGTGLGLPLVDALVRLHGGRLSLASEPGQGTVATVWLPPEASEAGVVPANDPRPAEAAAAS